MIIALFDMDGVLVEPHGYHQALIDTVKLVGSALGYPHANLHRHQIAAFEAAGITSEWDSAAACTALMLVDRWQKDGEVELPSILSPPYASIPGLAAPDFGALARALNEPALHGLAPAPRIEKTILNQANHLSACQVEILKDLIRNASSGTRSATHRAFQEFVLGSRLFAGVYPHPATLDTESYLLEYDRPSLTPAEQEKLADWFAPEGHTAAILTLRPSKPPKQAFSTPEAEIGLQLAGLNKVPIAGYGGLIWLAQRRGCDPRSLAKPSPIHALVALLLALGNSLPKALSSSARLVLDDRDDGEWEKLNRSLVMVFEDSPNGLESAIAARRVLRRKNIDLQIELYGVTPHPVKQRALKSTGAKIFKTFPQALRNAGIL